MGRFSRLLIYSHDSFGLGHIRRTRAIAQSLVARRDDLSILILSGSPVIGSFQFHGHIDFVRIPGVKKLRHGDYTSYSLDLDIEEVMSMRAEIIRRTAELFRPDIFLVDKEPLGMRGEVRDTLTMLKSQGTVNILGLRDVMDAPVSLADEWQRKSAIPALRDLYDQIWVYGLPQVFDPLEGLPIPPAVHGKTVYTGYIRRTPEADGAEPPPAGIDAPYILVTTGGGGDGEALVDWVLSAYETDASIPLPAFVVLGPFMPASLQGQFRERAERLDKVAVTTFQPNLESILRRAAGVVAMGGYNTFCEILSYDQRAVVVPRTVPRVEQYIRTARAQELGLLRMLEDTGRRDPSHMAQALRALPFQRRPSDVSIPGLLEGLPGISALVDSWLHHPGQASRLAVVGQGR
jgi:predicted glycosyltransferase